MRTPHQTYIIGWTLYASLISVVTLIIILSACHPTILPSIPEGSGFQIPVTPGKVETPTPATDPNIEEVIVVPASDKPTTIQITKKKKTLKQVFNEQFHNAPTHEVTSDNQAVTAFQPKHTVWWKWALLIFVGLLFIFGLIEAIAKRIANFSPWGVITKIFKR